MPNYMKPLTSKEPVPTIKKPKGFVVEPFDIQEVQELKPLNKTRKIEYPMMLRRYNVNKIQEWDIDDFRKAMGVIVKKDNDEIFTHHLNKKGGNSQ